LDNKDKFRSREAKGERVRERKRGIVVRNSEDSPKNFSEDQRTKQINKAQTDRDRTWSSRKREVVRRERDTWRGENGQKLKRSHEVKMYSFYFTQRN